MDSTGGKISEMWCSAALRHLPARPSMASQCCGDVLIGLIGNPGKHKPSLGCMSDLRRPETTWIQRSQRPPEGRKVRERGRTGSSSHSGSHAAQPLWAQCRAGGECVSCNCISFVVIWTEFVCLCPFFLPLSIWKSLRINKTMWWGDFAGGEEQMSPTTQRHTAPIRSWSLYNSAAAMQLGTHKKRADWVSCRKAEYQSSKCRLPHPSPPKNRRERARMVGWMGL